MLHESSVPQMFWDEALTTVQYLMDRISSSVIAIETPYHVLFKASPNYSFFHFFGRVFYVLLPIRKDLNYLIQLNVFSWDIKLVKRDTYAMIHRCRFFCLCFLNTAATIPKIVKKEISMKTFQMNFPKSNG